jgi:hypothetical protein
MNENTSSIAPKVTVNSPPGWILLLVIKTYLMGIMDALSVHRVFSIVYKSKKIQSVIMHCFFLNGILFLGSYFVFELMISPRIHSLLQSSLSAFLSSLLSFVYYVCMDVMWIGNVVLLCVLIVGWEVNVMCLLLLFVWLFYLFVLMVSYCLLHLFDCYFLVCYLFDC